MSDITINYKGESIATMNASGTKTLLTEGRYCEDDIDIVYVSPGGGGGGGSYPWFGPNTVKDYTKTITINLKNDTSWDSWTPSTSQSTILAAPTTYDFTYAFDSAQYVVMLVITSITTYTLTSSATKKQIPIANGRVEWNVRFGSPSDYSQHINLTPTTLAYFSTTPYFTTLYYYNYNGIKDCTTSAYGVYATSPGISYSMSGTNTTLSVKRSAIVTRCHNSYFATDRKGDIDAEKTNVVITFDVYKTPRTSEFVSVGFYDMLTAMNAAPEA